METKRRAAVLCLACVALSVLAGSCASPPDDAAVQTGEAPIVGGTAATSYPEAVIVTSGGFLPCSGALLAPRVVITAGHCRSASRSYEVLAPNAAGQRATASSDFTTYGGDPATSSDTLLLFLDTPVLLASYPEVSSAPVAPGTVVVAIGRTLDGTITMAEHVSPDVTIAGAGSSLGFPYNYEARPDLTESGDSGGPIEIAAQPDGSSGHVIVAIVDTDTVEQNINEEEPIDLFARLDLVQGMIASQIAAHGGLSGTAPGGEQGGEAGAPGGEGAPSPVSGQGGCAVGGGHEAPPFAVVAWLAIALLAFVTRRRGRGQLPASSAENPPPVVAVASGLGSSTTLPRASRHVPGAWNSVPASFLTDVQGEYAAPFGGRAHLPAFQRHLPFRNVHSPSIHTAPAAGCPGTPSTRGGGGG